MALRRPRSTGETEALAKRPRGRPYKFRQGAWEAAARRLDGSAWRGLLLVCPEQHAMQVILHVGEPDTERRRVPAALLSVPTQLTRPQTVQVAAEQAISSELLSLARHLQPSAANGARVALRGELLRSALNAMGCDLWSLENHGCLAALHLPYTSQEVSVAKDDDERYLRQLCNKLDLCPTAYGRCSSLHDVAQLLERQCKVTLAPKLLTPEAQLAMRRKLGVGIPLQVKDAFGATVHVLLCTEEVHVYNEGPRLVFSDTPQAAPQAPAAPPAPAQQREGWFCFSSRKTGQLYYWNEVTNVSTMDPPWSASGLSDGWKCQVDGKTGRLHFHHSQHGETTRLP